MRERAINQQIKQMIESTCTRNNFQPHEPSEISTILDLEELNIQSSEVESTQEVSADNPIVLTGRKQDNLQNQEKFQTPFTPKDKTKQESLEEKYLTEVKEVNEEMEETPYQQYVQKSPAKEKFKENAKELVKKITDFYEVKKQSPREEKQRKIQEQKLKIQQNAIAEHPQYFFMGQCSEKKPRRTK